MTRCEGACLFLSCYVSIQASTANTATGVLLLVDIILAEFMLRNKDVVMFLHLFHITNNSEYSVPLYFVSWYLNSLHKTPVSSSQPAHSQLSPSEWRRSQHSSCKSREAGGERCFIFLPRTNFSIQCGTGLMTAMLMMLTLPPAPASVQ